jgi:hypothetical protein
MDPNFADRLHTRGILITALIVVITAVPARGVLGADDPSLPVSAPAELVRALSLPGAADVIRRPAAVFVDHRHGEVFVADTVANRIVVFDREGLYRYQFGCADYIGSPLGIAVDSDGFVFVLGSSREGHRVVRFDFDGMYLDDVDLTAIPARQIRDLTLDDQDRLVLVDDEAYVDVISRDRELVRRIDVGAMVPGDQRRELYLGHPVVRNGQLWIPASNLGTVLVFDVETGDYVRSVGHSGSTSGELTFPIGVDVTSNGIVTVLDKMRFAVVCYDTEGRFLGEFGGKGFRDGWFYHPSLLACADRDRVVVGQILDGRIQICRIPGFVRTRLVQGSSTRRDDVDVTGKARTAGATDATLRQP